MVKIRLISDIHFDAGINGLETHSTKNAIRSPFGAYFSKELKKEQDCVTLIAGDIAASLTNRSVFLHTFFENQQVIFTEGNHLVYNKEGKTIYQLQAENRENFPITHLFWHYLENDWMWIPGTSNEVAVIGGTFFTDYEYTAFTLETYNQHKKNWFNLLQAWGYGDKKEEYIPVKRLTKKMIINENKSLANEGLNDFYWGNETLYSHITPDTYLKLNKLAKEEFIRCHNEITSINPNAKIILLTHHCLSPSCIDNKYVNNKSNASYVSNLEKWICKELPNVRLVHSGHVHCRKDFLFGKDKKRYIVNACGYIPRREPWIDNKFKPNFILDTKDL